MNINLKGAAWILLSSFFLSLMAVTIKYAGQRMNVWELLTIRSCFAIALLLPVIFYKGIDTIKTKRPGMHLLRGLLGGLAFVCFFLAVTHVDLTLATSLGFTRNLFVLVLAILLLKEVVGWRRSMATAVGFVGVVICLNPTGSQFNFWALWALGFALFAAFATITIKKLTKTENSLAIVFYTYTTMGVFTIGPALYYWQTPGLVDLLLIGVLSACSTLGQACLVLGLKAGDATVVAPFEYSRIIYATLFGYLLFAELPTSSTLAGSLVIICSTVYIAAREARLGRRTS